MSEENVEIVHHVYDAWNRRDFDEAARRVHGDFELHLVGGFADLVGEEFDHREGLLRFWRDLAGTVGGQIAVERTFDMGHRVALIGTLKGAGAESGAPSSLRFGQIWTFRDGKVIRVDSYYDPREALEAAGLREWAMSGENVEVVRKALDGYNAFMRGDLTREEAAAAVSQHLDPQFEIDWHGERTPDTPQHLRGLPESLRFWEQFRGAWADLAWEPLGFIEAPGDRVLTPIRQTSRGRESGVPMEVHFFGIWTIRDGRVRKVQLFRHHAEALEAVGLRE